MLGKGEGLLYILTCLCVCRYIWQQISAVNYRKEAAMSSYTRFDGVAAAIFGLDNPSTRDESRSFLNKQIERSVREELGRLEDRWAMKMARLEERIDMLAAVPLPPLSGPPTIKKGE